MPAAPTLDGLLRAVVESPADESVYLVLADWLEENDDPRRAELLRLHRRLLATCLEPESHPERSAWQARIVALLAEGVPPCVPQDHVVLPGGVEMTFSFIPPGSFLMGSPPGEPGWLDDVQHRVTLTKGYVLGVNPVTQAQWRAVMGSNPSASRGDDLPVEMVSWDDCETFCKELGKRDGRAFRLPTEAEWEYACRAGTTTRFYFGETISTDQANYNGYENDRKQAFRGEATVVGNFPANPWGLFDVHGNVEEWCRDWFVSLTGDDSIDPQVMNSDTCHVLRGGAWDTEQRFCSAGFRNFDDSSNSTHYIGCRIVLCPE